MKDSIRVVVKKPLLDPEVCYIPNNLETKQKIVGGNIEVIPYENGIDIYLNEEGKLMGLSPNLKLFHNGHLYDVLVGTVFFSKINDEGEAISLELDECLNVIIGISDMAIKTEEEQNRLAQLLKKM